MKRARKRKSKAPAPSTKPDVLSDQERMQAAWEVARDMEYPLADIRALARAVFAFGPDVFHDDRDRSALHVIQAEIQRRVDYLEGERGALFDYLHPEKIDARLVTRGHRMRMEQHKAA